MSHISKRAEELIATYGTTGSIRRLDREKKAIEKRERELKLADKNITKILRQRKRR